MDDGSSLLLGIGGLVVDRVLIDDSGRRVVHCSTDPELTGWCPACGARTPRSAWQESPAAYQILLNHAAARAA